MMCGRLGVVSAFLTWYFQLVTGLLFMTGNPTVRREASVFQFQPAWNLLILLGPVSTQRCSPENFLYFLLSCFILAIWFLTSQRPQIYRCPPTWSFPPFLPLCLFYSPSSYFVPFSFPFPPSLSFEKLGTGRWDWLYETWRECMEKVEKKKN